MTVRELVIETELQVQRLAGNKRNKTATDIAIWRLNTAQNRLIKQKIKPDPNHADRYVIDEKSNTDVQNLQTTNYSLISFKDTDTRSYGYLPYDFQYLLNCRSKVLDDCSPEFANALLAANTYSARVVDFADSTNSAAPYYNNILIGVAGITINYTSGVPSKDQKYEYIFNVCAAFKQLGVEAYYEQFDNIYVPGSFILVMPFPVSGAGTVQNSPITALVIDQVLQNAVDRTFKGLSNGQFQRYKTFTTGVREVPNRSVKLDFLYDAISYNYYDRPTPSSPISQMANNKMFVFSNKKFLVSEIIIDYIRKPRPISLTLNQTSELHESVHEEICALAAELILANQEAPNYPLKVQENISRLE